MMADQNFIETSNKNVFYTRNSINNGYSISKKLPKTEPVKSISDLDIVEISNNGKKAFKRDFLETDALKIKKEDAQAELIQKSKKISDSDMLEPSLYLIKIMLEKYTGRSIHLGSYINGSMHGKFDQYQRSEIDRLKSNLPSNTQKIRTLKINKSLEQIKFAAHGKIVTSSGDEFNFEIGFQMLSYINNLLLHENTKELDKHIIINSDFFSKENTKDIKFMFEVEDDPFKDPAPFPGNGLGFLVWKKEE